MDLGVLSLRSGSLDASLYDPGTGLPKLPPSHPAIIEWRAMTVIELCVVFLITNDSGYSNSSLLHLGTALLMRYGNSSGCRFRTFRLPRFWRARRGKEAAKSRSGSVPRQVVLPSKSRVTARSFEEVMDNRVCISTTINCTVFPSAISRTNIPLQNGITGSDSSTRATVAYKQDQDIQIQKLVPTTWKPRTELSLVTVSLRPSTRPPTPTHSDPSPPPSAHASPTQACPSRRPPPSQTASRQPPLSPDASPAPRCRRLR